MNEGLKKFNFPNGEIGVQFKPESSSIELYFETNNLMEILLSIDAIQCVGTKIEKIIIPCLPYQRQDRRCKIGESFSLNVFLKAIASISNCNIKILSYDVHGDIPKTINLEVINLDPTPYLNPDYLHGIEVAVSPDEGATKRAKNFAEAVGLDLVELNKVRVDGEVKSIEFKDKPFDVSKISGKKLLIVDDLCDGGATFIHSAKLLKSFNAKSVDLVVTHGLFTKGFDVFRGFIDNVYWFNYAEKSYNKKEIL